LTGIELSFKLLVSMPYSVVSSNASIEVISSQAVKNVVKSKVAATTVFNWLSTRLYTVTVIQILR